MDTRDRGDLYRSLSTQRQLVLDVNLDSPQSSAGSDSSTPLLAVREKWGPDQPYCCAPPADAVVFPIASPDSTSSTRRFC